MFNRFMTCKLGLPLSFFLLCVITTWLPLLLERDQILIVVMLKMILQMLRNPNFVSNTNVKGS